jgi:hypothetical protein
MFNFVRIKGLNNQCTRAQAPLSSAVKPFKKKLTSDKRRGIMKTIKVYIEGGVCTDVIIPKEFHNKLNYEIIDYDHIDAEKENQQASEQKG